METGVGTGSNKEPDGSKGENSKMSVSELTEQQKEDRRVKNREHAKLSRVRKRFVLGSLQKSVTALEEENAKLLQALREHLPQDAETLIAACLEQERTKDGKSTTETTDEPDYSLVKALQTAKHSFLITDPTQSDNPIVYASQGFLDLTGYALNQVLGQNCRFLQGPLTDQKTVDKVRKGITEMQDTTVVLLNYRADGSTFWNQFFVAALRNREGTVVNYLGVQSKVSKKYATAFLQQEALEEAKKEIEKEKNIAVVIEKTSAPTEG